jgi:hypothetical protein
VLVFIDPPHTRNVLFWIYLLHCSSQWDGPRTATPTLLQAVGKFVYAAFDHA